MPGVHSLWLFVVSGLLLNITPGQDTLYIVGRTMSQGRRAGLLSVLGISSGSVIHTLAAAFGLSAILATSAMAFSVVKLTNVLNPKVALFFMAFLPQFVDPATDSRILAFLFLGGVFIVNGTLWCLVLVWGASAMSRRLRSNQATGLLLKRAVGAIFVGLGARLAFTK